MSQDTIAEMLTRLRNANRARHHYAYVPYTRANLVLSKLLHREGYLRDVARKSVALGVNHGRARPVRPSRARDSAAVRDVIVLRLKYRGRYQRPVIHNLKRLSRPSLRNYSRSVHLPVVFNGMGTVFVSTSAGMMTDRTARRLGLGGEVVCSVW
jgi:small subunit ribosomal protein S8